MMCPVQGHAGYLDQGRAAQNFSREIAQAGQRSLGLATARTEFSLGFTNEGCREAATIDLATPNDTFGLVDTGNCLVLQTIGATTTSPKVIRDENLSWVQLTDAKTRMIGCLKSCGWNKNEISQLVLFFLSLDVHPIRSRPYGLEAVMRYQERVRRDWTSNLKTGATYLINQVNNELMKEHRDEISSEIQASYNVSKVPPPNQLPSNH